MTSQIDITKPVFGTPTTQSVRDNFTTAANEISVLQQQTTGSPFLSLQGGRMAGPMYLYNDPTDAMMPATKGYVDAGGSGGGGGIPEAPSVPGDTFGRSEGAWVQVLALAGGTMLGPLIAAADPTDPLGMATKQYVDALKPSILPDAPDDAFFYGRHQNAWAQVLSLAGGQLSGSLIVSPAPPSWRATGYVHANNAISSGNVATNAYLDSTSTWRYLVAGAAGAIGIGANGIQFQGAAAGAVGAAVTFGTPVAIDYKGNLLLGNAPVIPTDAQYPIVSSMDHVVGIQGHFAFNAYVSQTGPSWKYLSNGYAANIFQNNSNGNFVLTLGPSGSAGGNITYNPGFVFDQSGGLTVPGTITANGQISSGNTSMSNSGFLTTGNIQTTNGSLIGLGTCYPNGTSMGTISGISGGGIIISCVGSSYQVQIQNTADPIFRWWNGPGNLGVMNCSTGGTLTIAANLVQGSDIRHKQDIEPLQGSLDQLAQLKPSRFAWKHTPDKQCCGFIAQDLEDVIPEALGEVLHPKGNTTKGVDLMAIVAVVTAAVQELSREVQGMRK